jgi:hypothetical protein
MLPGISKRKQKIISKSLPSFVGTNRRIKYRMSQHFRCVHCHSCVGMSSATSSRADHTFGRYHSYEDCPVDEARRQQCVAQLQDHILGRPASRWCVADNCRCCLRNPFHQSRRACSCCHRHTGCCVRRLRWEVPDGSGARAQRVGLRR